MWRFTGLHGLPGLPLHRNDDAAGSYPGKVTLDDVNIRPLPESRLGRQGMGHRRDVDALALDRVSGSASVWVETGWWNGTYHKGLKDSLGYRDPNLDAPLWSWQEFRASGTAVWAGGRRPAGEHGGTSLREQAGRLDRVRPARATDNIWNGDRRAAVGGSTRAPVRWRLRPRPRRWGRATRRRARHRSGRRGSRVALTARIRCRAHAGVAGARGRPCRGPVARRAAPAARRGRRLGARRRRRRRAEPRLVRDAPRARRPLRGRGRGRDHRRRVRSRRPPPPAPRRRARHGRGASRRASAPGSTS